MSLELAKVAAEAARSKKASRIVFLDLRGKSDICDFQLICSGDSDRQTKAICDAIEDVCKEKMQVRPISIEGKGSGQWILLDFGSLIVHVFLNQLRDYYALENLWPGSIISDHDDEGGSSSLPEKSDKVSSV